MWVQLCIPMGLVTSVYLARRYSLRARLKSPGFTSFSLPLAALSVNKDDEATVRFTPDALAHLLPFAEMTVLELDDPLDVGVELKDDDLDATAVASPNHARVLRLSRQQYNWDDIDDVVVPPVSFAAFLRLAGSCKKLKEIQLTLDAVYPPSGLWLTSGKSYPRATSACWIYARLRSPTSRTEWHPYCSWRFLPCKSSSAGGTVVAIGHSWKPADVRRSS
ncbi:hypothetical protein LshimejAT787_1100920 [Lyophyllum shimeji]|uniref:Uncharacterized protein n=1 Tax=Lyophyllum shimeji TaxID=47721 RepID=A0A9P3PVL4_LYOSH|nr:hypothetical protein LshimejAT787_1100920 [Lyophyllum shimeji]